MTANIEYSTQSVFNQIFGLTFQIAIRIFITLKVGWTYRFKFIRGITLFHTKIKFTFTFKFSTLQNIQIFILRLCSAKCIDTFFVSFIFFFIRIPKKWQFFIFQFCNTFFKITFFLSAVYRFIFTISTYLWNGLNFRVYFSAFNIT